MLDRLAICDECQAAIIAGTVQNDPVLSSHLKNCEECQSFAAFYSEMLAVEPAVDKVDFPEFSELKALADQRKESSSRFLRLFVVPVSAAAALVLAIGGVFFQMHLTKTPAKPTVVALRTAVPVGEKDVKESADIATGEDALPDYLSNIFADSEAFAAALEEHTVTLAWDQTSNREMQWRNSMSAASSNDNWSIDYFNPYNEE